MQTYNKTERELLGLLLEQMQALVIEFRELKDRQIEMNRKLSNIKKGE